MTKKKALVIDDEMMVRYSLKKMLGALGFDVLEASDGQEGERLVDAEPDLSLIVTDIIMPRQEGVETISNIRRKLPDIPLVAISGGGRIRSLDFLDIAQKAGASAVLPKPFTKDDLKTALVTSAAI
jgi:CheY-like chemotaxis protein